LPTHYVHPITPCSSATRGLCTSLRLRDQVSYSHKTTGNIVSYSLIFVSRQQTLHYVRFLKILCHCFVPTCACLCDVLKFNCLSSMPTGSQCQKCKKHSKQAETAFHARFILSHLFKAVRDRQCKYLSTYVSGFLTAVAVFRKPNAIPLCFSIDPVLNFL